MKLSTSDLHLLRQCAISAAYQAGHIISHYTHRPISVEIKKSGSSQASQVVTEVDRLCEETIKCVLAPTCSTYDLALLTEESPDNLLRLEKDFFWCIDPLDGTLAFIESTSGYAVSIALVARDGTPYIGVVYDPLEQTLYHAVKGSGAFRNGQHWGQDSTQPENCLTFISDRSFTMHQQFPQILTALQNISAQLGYVDLKTIQQGGAAMNACWVLDNRPACYFKYPKPEDGGGCLWDYAATACLLTEAGAIVCDMAGHLLDLNRPDSTFMNHTGVLYASDKNIGNEIKQLFQSMSHTE